MASSARKQTWIYAAVLAGCVAIGMLLSLSPPAKRVNNIAYDWMSSHRAVPGGTPHSAVVAIDEQTLHSGGMSAIRSILAEAIDKVNAAQPAAVADDVLLADETTDQAGNAELDAALRATKNLILPCDLVTVNGRLEWEDPLPRFARSGVLGHVFREQSLEDGVNRFVPLEEIAGGEKRWALALQTFAAVRGKPITKVEPDGVEVGDLFIPAPDADGTQMWIRYVPGGVPVVSALSIDQHRDLLRGKAVFIGVTAVGAGDRPVTPFGQISGVGLHAQIYETIARGQFLTPARNDVELLLCVMFAAAAGLIFGWRSGWLAYGLAVLVMAAAVWTPVIFFDHQRIFPFFEPVFIAWLSVAAAATFQHFFVRRQLRTSESERSRYQQAIHWAAHEMRTPLTAIQGSSEIMTRYKLPEAKSHAVERDDQLRIEAPGAHDPDVPGCRTPGRRPDGAEARAVRGRRRRRNLHARAPKSSASAKRSTYSSTAPVEGTIKGDRELMEYALYNLLTNAVKYSPAETEIHVTAALHNGELRLSVRDQGIGMDAKEIKNIFKKFYRTKRAEASGEAGTGIGLSIVEQIVTHHGGRMEVTSEPGKGSCFTMVVAAAVSSPRFTQCRNF